MIYICKNYVPVRDFNFNNSRMETTWLPQILRNNPQVPVKHQYSPFVVPIEIPGRYNTRITFFSMMLPSLAFLRTNILQLIKM